MKNQQKRFEMNDCQVLHLEQHLTLTYSSKPCDYNTQSGPV